MTSAFLTRLPLNAPQNCTRKNGQKRRWASRANWLRSGGEVVALTGFFAGPSVVAAPIYTIRHGGYSAGRASMQGPRLRRVAPAHVEYGHAQAEQPHAALQGVVSGVAVFEIVGALQPEPAILVARRLQAGDRDGVVEQQQPFGGARRARRGDSRFARLQAVEPEPGDGDHSEDAGELQSGHGSVGNFRDGTGHILDHAPAAPES